MWLMAAILDTATTAESSVGQCWSRVSVTRDVIMEVNIVSALNIVTFGLIFAALQSRLHSF